MYLILAVALFTTPVLKPDAECHLLAHTLAFPAYYVLETTLHEGSHALMFLANGRKVLEFKPYPSITDGSFYLGYTNGEIGMNNTAMGVMLIAPLITDTVVFAAADLWLSNVNAHSVTAEIVFMAGMLAPLVDFAFNALFSSSSEGDLGFFTATTGVPRGVTLGIGLAMTGVGIWRVIVQGQRVFFQ